MNEFLMMPIGLIATCVAIFLSFIGLHGQSHQATTNDNDAHAMCGATLLWVPQAVLSPREWLRCISYVQRTCSERRRGV